MKGNKVVSCRLFHVYLKSKDYFGRQNKFLFAKMFIVLYFQSMTPLSTLCPRLPQIVSASQILMWWLYEFVKAKTKSRNQTFEIPPVTEVQMLDLINKIPSSKAIGCDGLKGEVSQVSTSVPDLSSLPSYEYFHIYWPLSIDLENCSSHSLV